MKLYGSELEELKNALLSAYPYEVKLEQMLTFKLNRNLREIAHGYSHGDLIYNLISTAESEGWTKQLIEAAHASNPGNEMLESFYQKYMQNITIPENAQQQTDEKIKSKQIFIEHQATEPTVRSVLEAKKIHFPNGNTALVVKATSNMSAIDILKALGIKQPKALLLVIGGANALDDPLNIRLKLLCNLGIANIATEEEAMIIDGGTQEGIMEMIGEAIADRGHRSILLGVAPSGDINAPGEPVDISHPQRVPLDSNHSHFMLVEGNNWEDDTDMMFKLADELGKNIPVVTILVNGGEIAKHEAWYSTRRGWPLIVMKGSGRTADAIATFWEKKNAQEWNVTATITDPELIEIIDKGDVHLFPIDGTIEQFQKIMKLLLYRTVNLSQAWKLFSLYDKNAVKQRKYSERLQLGIISIGLLASALVILQVLLRASNSQFPGTFGDQIVHSIIVLLPIIISLLIAGNSYFDPGRKWILLRSSAESIRREIYRYRSETGEYKKYLMLPSQTLPSSQEKHKVSFQEKFMDRITDIRDQLTLSDLDPYTGPIPPMMYGAEANDDGYSKLSPDAYISIRIDDQSEYFRSRTNQLSRDLTRYYWLILIVGGVGTLLAALGLEPIVGLTAFLAVAFATYLEARQTKNILVQYNQTLTELENIKNWWMGLPKDECGEIFDDLVSVTEQILLLPEVAWMEQVKNARDFLRSIKNKDKSKQ